VILGFNGEKVKSNADLPPMVTATAIGEKAQLEVLRDGKRQMIPVTIGRLEEERDVAARVEKPIESENALDLTVSDLTSEQRDRLGVNKGGVLITEVKPGPVANAGVRRGDVILEINRKPVNDANSFGRIASEAAKSQSTLLLLKRSGSSLFVVVENAS
jgi:serine protease Do